MGDEDIHGSVDNLNDFQSVSLTPSKRQIIPTRVNNGSISSNLEFGSIVSGQKNDNPINEIEHQKIENEDHLMP